MSQVLTWITWHLKPGEMLAIRVFELNEKMVYSIDIKNRPKKGLEVIKIVNEPTLVGKILCHWNNIVTYDMLSVFQRKNIISLE